MQALQMCLIPVTSNATISADSINLIVELSFQHNTALWHEVSIVTKETNKKFKTVHSEAYSTVKLTVVVHRRVHILLFLPACSSFYFSPSLPFFTSVSLERRGGRARYSDN